MNPPPTDLAVAPNAPAAPVRALESLLGAPAACPARTLVDVFAATVTEHGNRVALDAGDRVLSYRALDAAATKVADRLRALGIGAGDRVGVRVPSGSSDLYVAILGTLKAGAAYVPVDADDPPARAESIWRRSRAAAVIEQDLVICELTAPAGRRRSPEVEDDAWIIFTSGSTGEPKGVAVTHRAAAAFVDAEALLWTISPADRVLAGLSVGFDASCEEMWTAWRHGAALVPAPRALVRSGVELGPWLADRGVTVISTVPTLAAMWDEDALAGVRLLILGGESCPEALAWRLASEREVWNTYGPTEATVVSTAARLSPGRPVTIGWPLEGWQVAVVDENGQRTPVGEPGELVISGVGLGRYLDPALDEGRFAALPSMGWSRAYRTGDIVRESIEGLEFVGRRDDQVKVGGRRIELGEIDAALRSAPGVRAAAAAVRKTPAGNTLLVGYVVGEAESAEVRAHVAERLPGGIVPLVVVLEGLPVSSSGKVDRRALPWPPPARSSGADGTGQHAGATAGLGETAAWLAQRWADQLGPLPITLESDFFELGGSSLAAAKLVSVLRKRFPAVAVADIYHHRRLGDFAAHLDALARPSRSLENEAPAVVGRRWPAVQVAGMLVLIALSAPGWVTGILAFDKLAGAGLGPSVGWGWLLATWLVFGSAPGRAALVVLARTVLLRDLRPGRYPRQSWLACRVWFIERMTEVYRLDRLAGTPLAPRYARLCGLTNARNVRLGTLPPAAGIMSVGDGATLEADVDVNGWWMEAGELVVGEVKVGAGARVGTRSVLMPGADVGDGAELEPGTVVTGRIPAGERWAGSPARRVGLAGERWPAEAAPLPTHRRAWKAMYGVGMVLQNLVTLAAAVPGLLLVTALAPAAQSTTAIAGALLVLSPLIAASYVLCYALLVALAVRLSSRLVRAGWHPDEGATGWALWFGESMMAAARVTLFPLFSSLYTRPWLRLAGIRIGRRTEISTAVGLNRLVSLGETSFATDDVIFAGARTRNGWLHLAPIEVGDRTFLGNGALMTGETRLGNDSLVGVLTTAPERSADGTSWFGSPALELPRVPDCPDPRRTTSPPRRLLLARAAMEMVRLLLPGTVSVALAAGVFLVLETVRLRSGLPAMVLITPVLILAAGLVATAFTIAAKWILMGRYRVGEHPLWSFFIWRDEIINSCQEQLAGTWFLNSAMGGPVMNVYLRAMGARVGRGVWCETMTITEFDLVDLGDGCAINRQACVETHLFHDRLMRTGPIAIGRGATMGPATAVLPDAKLGAGCSVGARSAVLRGEELPAHTRWHGAPVTATA